MIDLQSAAQPRLCFNVLVRFLPLILKKTLRNKRRTVLTVLSIAMSLFLITTLRTLLTSLEDPNLTPESALRIVTRHKVSLANVMPVAYADRIRQIPGVEEVNANQWFGGIYQDPANFFANFAVDHETFFTVYPDVETSAAEREAFESERIASLVGVNLAERFGWEIGDRVTLEGTFAPFDVETIVRGFVSGANSENTFYFRWDYYDELFERAGIAGTFTIRAESAEVIPAVIESIDAEFANTNAPTKTESEKSFILGFMEMWGNIRALIVSISTVVLFTIILVAANTMAMSIRERTGEIAILKTIGFNRRQILGLIVVESVTIAVAGGLLGSLGARYLYGSIDFNQMTMGFIPQFIVRWDTVALAAAIALSVAMISTAVPAYNASRLAIVDAVRRRGE